MAIKVFDYMFSEYRKEIVSLTEDDNLKRLGSRDWAVGNRVGKFEMYLVSPGFYVEIFKGDGYPFVTAVGEETKEGEFRVNLESKLGLGLKLR